MSRKNQQLNLRYKRQNKSNSITMEKHEQRRTEEG